MAVVREDQTLTAAHDRSRELKRISVSELRAGDFSDINRVTITNFDCTTWRQSDGNIVHRCCEGDAVCRDRHCVGANLDDGWFGRVKHHRVALDHRYGDWDGQHSLFGPTWLRRWARGICGVRIVGCSRRIVGCSRTVGCSRRVVGCSRIAR